MADIPALPVSVTGAQAPAAGVRPQRSAAPGASPAFEALLERLSARAAELDTKSRALESPEDLPGAVDAARASLEDALTLGEQLLEAYRASRGNEVRP
jgi:hypothetical protein